MQKRPSYQHAQNSKRSNFEYLSSLWTWSSDSTCGVFGLCEGRYYARIKCSCHLRFFAKKGPLTNTLRIRKGATLNICQVCGLGAAILRAACLVYVKDAITRIRVFLQLTVFAKKALLPTRSEFEKGATLNICQSLWTWSSDSTCGVFGLCEGRYYAH